MCDGVLADLDVVFRHCVAATANGEDMDAVIEQVRTLKDLVYAALEQHLIGMGASETTIEAFRQSATYDRVDGFRALQLAYARAPLAA
jgi:hypothetical protein